MKEIPYQIEYIDKIAQTAVEYLRDFYRTQSTIILKAPTGSGKTYLISQALTKIVKEMHGTELCFIWISVNTLHEQSKTALERYLEDERLLECISINEILDNEIEQNQIVFINWDSLIKENNVFRMDNELNWNLETVVANTKEAGREIILVIDESHRTAKADKAQDVIREISPRLIIEMTATPLDKKADITITIPLAKVIEQGMIKKSVLINPGTKNVKETKDMLEVALKKRKELAKAYKSLGININPLLLVQIPNRKQSDAGNPEDYIKAFLADFDITEQNGLLATRLSGGDNAELDAKVKPLDSKIEVLIFKESIALGWDCPRAAILFLQREWKSERYIFNIQTLGRIMRMPEQVHYAEHDELNVGYVYSASDNFEVVSELAENYVSSVQMSRDELLIKKPIKLLSEFIRRKRELTRLSGDFRKCLLDAAKEMQTELDGLNYKIDRSQKDIGVDGEIKDIDKDQDVEFTTHKQIEKDRVEVVDAYTTFCAGMTSPYSKARSDKIIMSSLRTWFKLSKQIDNEDKIAYIVMFKPNTPIFTSLLENAKEKYAKLPEKNEEIVQNLEWEVPGEVSIFSDYEEYKTSNKSIIKENESKHLFVRKNKNGKIEFSGPEEKFIAELENTDDDVLWWFKNGAGESKYFGIAYKKQDNHYYAFYPDFLIKTKKETLIVEIKDDNDFKSENALKLQAGKDYIKRAENKEPARFYILSPQDFARFFQSVQNQELDGFSSFYERNLLHYSASQKVILKDKGVETEKEKEEFAWLSELERTIAELDDEKERNELLKLDLANAKATIEQLRQKPAPETAAQPLNLQKPFNMCVLGEVASEQEIREQLNKYFQKYGFGAVDWNIEFFNNASLQRKNLLRSLIKGQSKYNLALTGQIHHHSGKSNASANLLTELKSDKYIPHLVACNPQEMLTCDGLIKILDEYLNSREESNKNDNVPI